MQEIASSRSVLGPEDVDWLQALMADWQILADLFFADLVLWIPDHDGKGFWAVGQVRPNTARTVYPEDVLGTFLPAGPESVLASALSSGRIVTSTISEAIPVRRAGRVVAVVERTVEPRREKDVNDRAVGDLEQSYRETAADIATMIAEGAFPSSGQRSDDVDSPRVGDGYIRLDSEGAVVYASPNALSAFRRLGSSRDLAGRRLADVVREVVPASSRQDEETISAVLGGRSYRDMEVFGPAHTSGGVTLVARSIPLLARGVPVGALLLVRDVSDLRRRDRQLVTKDATIREIHHRVKNNLQTVAALLRLQARRIGEPSAQAALGEAERRVGSIALVHEILSQQPVEGTVEFDEIADRLGSTVGETTGVGVQIRFTRTGGFGAVPSEVATPLAMVLTELFQNAVEHGLRGRAGVGEVGLTVRTEQGRLVAEVTDDGAGLPAGFDLATSPSLGLSIVRTLVESELGGAIVLENREPGPGTRATITLTLAAEPRQ